MTNPFISIVIPTYNHAHFLKRALKSLEEQVYTNFEVIIVDNNSIDNTQVVIKSFFNLKIVYLKINNNGVIAASRNIGIKAANGEWVAFLDSDDWWTSDKLQTCVNHINNNVDFIYHDLKVIGQKNSILKSLIFRKLRKVKKSLLLEMLIHGNPISNSSVLVRKKLIQDAGGLNENFEMIGAEDFNLWLKIANITNKFLYIPRFLGYYEYHLNGVSRKDMSECHKVATNEFLINLDLKYQSQITAHILYMKGSYFMSQKKTTEASFFFKQSFKFGNFILKAKIISKLAFMYFKYNIK